MALLSSRWSTKMELRHTESGAVCSPWSIKKKKAERRRKEVKTMDGRTTPSSSSLPSFPFVEIVEFK